MVNLYHECSVSIDDHVIYSEHLRSKMVVQTHIDIGNKPYLIKLIKQNCCFLICDI